MGSWSRTRNTVGLLALGASIALASPGVNVVQADSERPVAQAAPPPQCSASGPEVPVDHQVEAVKDQLRRRQAERNAPDEDVVTLNNSGYNYDPPLGIDLDAIRPEARDR